MRQFSLGPATMVTAAFIGPGTIVTATLAGAKFGHSLIWALLFAVIAGIVLQEMCARLGVITGEGLGRNLYHTFHSPVGRKVTQILVVSAIVVGNAAYQGGNLSGAAIGLGELSGSEFTWGNVQFWPVITSLIAFVILWRGHYQWLEKSLIALVMIMSLCFVSTFAVTEHNWGELISGSLIPSMPDGASLTVIALIGTTVVPYNLFLHSDSVALRWKGEQHLAEARQDIFVSLPIGGLISIAILSVAASAWFGQNFSFQSPAQLSTGLKPVFGEMAGIMMAVGLFAAGISSALTAPVAAAFALKGVLNLKGDMRSASYRLVWVSILALGTILAAAGLKPTQVILFAQVANGLLLPLLVAFLLWVMNSKAVGHFRNSTLQNGLGLVVLLIALILSMKSLSAALGFLH